MPSPGRLVNNECYSGVSKLNWTEGLVGGKMGGVAAGYQCRVSKDGPPLVLKDNNAIFR